MSSDTNPRAESRPESDTQDDTPETDSSTAGATAAEELPYESTPTLVPTLIWLGIVLALGIGSIAFVSANPEAFGGPETGTLIIRGLFLLTLIGAVRFLVRLYVLRRTEYVVDGQSVTRRYELLFRSWQREVPLAMVRSHEARQSRIQKLLGYGTVALNQGLGAIELENIPDPYEVDDLIARLIDEK